MSGLALWVLSMALGAAGGWAAAVAVFGRRSGAPDPRPARTSGPVLRAADAAMYEAKRQGRNRVIEADPAALAAKRA